MAVIHADQIANMVNALDKEHMADVMVDLVSELQDRVALSQLMRNDHLREAEGTGIDFIALTAADENTRDAGMFDVDNLNQVSGTVVGNVPWRKTTTGWTYDVDQAAMSAGKGKKFVDFVKIVRQQNQIGLVDHFEERFWGEPSSSTDTLTPFGLPYWLVYNASEGHYGGNNTNFSSGPAGIDRDTYDLWKNYTFNYTSWSEDDALDKIDRAIWTCNFKPVYRSVIRQPGSAALKYAMYTTYDIKRENEKAAAGQNDNLQFDTLPARGKSSVAGVPLIAVPYLQKNMATQDPVFGIDWSVFHIYRLKSRWMVRSPAYRASDQHNVVRQHIDCVYNIVCLDPKRCFLGAKATIH